MAILVAPVVAQLSVLPVPELMPVGVAVKEVIAGPEYFPENEFNYKAELQPASPTQANRINTIAHGSNPEARSSPRVLSPILQNEPAESMRSPWAVVDDTILATPLSSQSVLQKPFSQGMTLVTTKMVGKQTALRFS